MHPRVNAWALYGNAGAQQARELACRTGTTVVVNRGGQLAYLKSEETVVGLGVREPVNSQGGKE